MNFLRDLPYLFVRKKHSSLVLFIYDYLQGGNGGTLRWHRTKGFAGFTHRFEIFQLPTLLCLHFNKVPPETRKHILLPSALLQIHWAGQITGGSVPVSAPEAFPFRHTRRRAGREVFATSLISLYSEAGVCGTGPGPALISDLLVGIKFENGAKERTAA